MAWRVTIARSSWEGGRGARSISRAEDFNRGEGIDKKDIGEPGGVVIGENGP